MKRMRYFNGEDYEEVDAQETNGNLVLIVKDDGTVDWVCAWELEDAR